MIYCFICPTCSKQKEVKMTISEMEELSSGKLLIMEIYCCGNMMNRDYQAEHLGRNNNALPLFSRRGFGWSEESYSKDIDQIEIEHRKRGLPVARYSKKRWDPKRDQYYPGKEI